MKIPRNFARRVLLLALAVIASGAGTEAQAQSLFFDWGSSEKLDDSGREVVRLKTPGRAGEVIVSFGDRKIYFIVQPGQALSYPIAIPREQSRWSGVTSVSMKRENPAWTPTPEMMRENPRLPSWVPGGHPMNPLGTRALYLGESSYRIHGTDAPWTIGSAASKGCVRMYNKDVQDLYPRVRVGAKVTVTWSTFETAPVDDAKEIERVVALAPVKARDQDGAAEPRPRTAHDEAVPQRKEAAKELVEPAIQQANGRSGAYAKAVEPQSAGNAPAKSPAPSSPAGTLETGAIVKTAPAAPVAAAETSDAIASRAAAAAERAAAAADRAAAAAERVLAAVNRQGASAAAPEKTASQVPASDAVPK